ncbi:nitrogen fixation-related uncharacterized protein [Desulfitispora alkaliphila]|uniref:hypothetical protein n=1 Tax=Desulfitispora alkaliphila TaxID=622674 RepID=UPI003D1C858B
MRYILALTTLVPLISWIARYKNYIHAILHMGKKQVRTNNHAYLVLSFGTHIVSSFMHIAGMAFIYHLFSKEKPSVMSLKGWEFTIHTALARGFALTVLWSPMHPAFAYGIFGTQAPLFATIGKGLILAFVGMGVGALVYMWQFGRGESLSSWSLPISLAENGPPDSRLVTEIFVWLGIILASIFALYSIYGEILVIVPIVILIVTFIYFLWNRDLQQYKKLWARFITDELPHKKKETILIISAGVLVSTLKGTGFGQVFFDQFLLVTEWFKLDFLVGLTLLVIFLGFTGLPPIPAMVLLATIINDVPYGYSPELVTLSLLLGVAITLIIAPVTIPLLMMSSLNRYSLFDNGFKANIIFGIIFLVVGQMVIQYIF